LEVETFTPPTTRYSSRMIHSVPVEEKTEKIVPTQGKWKVYFLGFSRSGWTSGALAYQEEINRQPIQRENWVSTGMRLITLDELDYDMTQWTK
jgi:hypothetical protein